LALRNSSRAQGCRIGLDTSATRNCGFPGTGLCAGSKVTGPGPLAGGRNSCAEAIHAVELSGPKFGGAAFCAAAPDISTAAAHANTLKPDTIGRIAAPLLRRRPN